MPKRTAVDNPSPAHARDAESIMQFFSAESGIATVLLVGACARGKATEDTDLDILVLRAPGATENVRVTLTERWERFTPPVSEFLRQRVSMQRSISNSAMVILYRSRGGGRPVLLAVHTPSLMTSGFGSRSRRFSGSPNSISSSLSYSRSRDSRARRSLTKRKTSLDCLRSTPSSR